MGFSDPGTEVIECPFYRLSWVVLVKANLPRFKERGYRPHFSWREVSRTLQLSSTALSCLISYIIILWGSISITPILQMRTTSFREIEQVKQPYSRAWAPNYCPKDSLPVISDALPSSECFPNPPAQTPRPFFPHLFLLLYVLQIPFCVWSSQWHSHLHPIHLYLEPEMKIPRKAARQVWPMSNVSYLWVLLYKARVGMAFVLGNPHYLRTAAMVGWALVHPAFTLPLARGWF